MAARKRRPRRPAAHRPQESAAHLGTELARMFGSSSDAVAESTHHLTPRARAAVLGRGA